MKMTDTLTAPPARSIVTQMAHQYGMERENFERTLKKTVIPSKVEATNEQLASFLIVCKQYDLNPFIKEIYAYPKRDGGIQPIVPIDGWISLSNRNPAYDGLDFVENENDKGELISVTCAIFRKDRQHPTRITEHLSECRRDTEQWRQMPRRMLRHKAFIQCARIAFGFAGIVDPDEAERMAEMGIIDMPSTTAARATQSRLADIKEKLAPVEPNLAPIPALEVGPLPLHDDIELPDMETPS
jgi:phage recombination protein Bet